MFDASIMASALHQNAPHRQRGSGKEMPAPIPLARLSRDTKIRFVNQRGRLKGLMRLPLTGKPGPRELSQFVIDFRHELARCSRAIRILGIGSHEASAL
jgi:hypothetical protein